MGIELVEGHAMPDHVHLCLSIPPKYSVANAVGRLKGKSAIRIHREYLVLQRGFEMWCHAAPEPCVEGGQNDHTDRDRAKDGCGDPRYCALGGGVVRLSCSLQPPVPAARTAGSSAYLSAGGAGGMAAHVDRAEGAGGGRRRPQGGTGHAGLHQ